MRETEGQPDDNGQEIKSPAPEEVRAYLSALLGRSEFTTSERNRRFLSYVVEETLEGRAARIKAYTIALAAFDRGADFDPLTDPIVRIEASRLRRALELYYLTAGKADPIRIDIPKGSYAATFTFNEHESKAEEPVPSAADPVTASSEPGPPVSTKRWGWVRLASAVAALILLLGGISVYTLIEHGQRFASNPTNSRGPSVIVLPFEDTGGDPARSFVARGLTYEIIGNLTRFDDLFVFGSETSFGLAPLSGTVQPGREIKPDYVLSGSVNADDAKIRVSAFLADAATGQYLWSSTVERALTTSGLMQIQKEIADQVAAAIAQPYGFIFERKVHEISSKPAENLVSYECVVRFRQYWRSFSDRDFGGVRACLEQTIVADPSYASGYSSLALLYIDSYRFGFGSSNIHFDPLKRAAELADKAIELEPDASDGYLAKSMALWFLDDLDGSIKTARRGLEINPYNTDLLADLGLRLAQRMRWNEAMPLIEAAYARNPGAPSGYHIANFLHAYMEGDYQAALESALKLETPNVIYGAVTRAMAYAQLGDTAKAREEVSQILAIDPRYGDHVAEDMAKRNLAPELIRAYVEGLEKAGLHAGSAY